MAAAGIDLPDQLGIDHLLHGAVEQNLALVQHNDPRADVPHEVEIVLDLSFSRFTRMSDAEKDASLRAWTQSRLGVRRMGFMALRNLCLLGYYSQPATWQAIGYKGPLLDGGIVP